MVRKWFSIINPVTTVNTFVSKVAKHLAATISPLNTIRGGDTVGFKR